MYYNFKNCKSIKMYLDLLNGVLAILSMSVLTGHTGNRKISLNWGYLSYYNCLS